MIEGTQAPDLLSPDIVTWALPVVLPDELAVLVIAAARDC
jgi:hypothetical protein